MATDRLVKNTNIPPALRHIFVVTMLISTELTDVDTAKDRKCSGMRLQDIRDRLLTRLLNWLVYICLS